jgi:hypothetical protein
VILVAGEVSHDYLIHPPMANDRFSGSGGDASIVVRTGGADLIAKLLAAAAPEYGIEVLAPSAHSLVNGVSSHKSDATTVVDLSVSSSRRDSSFEVTRVRHIAQSLAWHTPSIEHAVKAGPDTVVITGSGDSSSNVEHVVDLLRRVHPGYIVHHMTRPLACGKLWDVVRNWPNSSSTIPDPDNLVVIVDADDLRAEGINLSKGLSWEATSEDFVRNLGSNGRLDTLVTCPNLIVRFGTEGVIHHRGRDTVNPKLYFNARRMECETVQGSASSMVSTYLLVCQTMLTLAAWSRTSIHCRFRARLCWRSRT